MVVLIAVSVCVRFQSEGGSDDKLDHLLVALEQNNILRRRAVRFGSVLNEFCNRFGCLIAILVPRCCRYEVKQFLAFRHEMVQRTSFAMLLDSQSSKLVNKIAEMLSRTNTTLQSAQEEGECVLCVLLAPSLMMCDRLADRLACSR